MTQKSNPYASIEAVDSLTLKVPRVPPIGRIALFASPRARPRVAELRQAFADARALDGDRREHLSNCVTLFRE
jgi:hypothetical protein